MEALDEDKTVSSQLETCGDDIYLKWLSYLQTQADTSSIRWTHWGKHTSNHSENELIPQVTFLKRFVDDQQKSYSSEDIHPGNSYIEFQNRGSTTHAFGSIRKIFRTNQIRDVYFLAISVFEDLQKEDRQLDPYIHIPRIPCKLLQRRGLMTVTSSKNVMGHLAVLRNPPGTFGLKEESFSIAALHNASKDRR